MFPVTYRTKFKLKASLIQPLFCELLLDPLKFELYKGKASVRFRRGLSAPSVAQVGIGES